VHDLRGEIATVDLDTFRDRGTFTLDGECYMVRAAEWHRSRVFVLGGPEGTVARARDSVLRRWLEVDYDGRHLTVEPASSPGRAFVVNEGAVQLGTVRRPLLPLFRRRLDVVLLPDVPLAVDIFLTWLVLLRMP
jgi:hypothetical protein